MPIAPLGPALIRVSWLSIERKTKMKNCNLLMIAAGLAFVSGVAGAATNTLVNGATNWNLPASWAEQSVPSANDVALIPANATVYLDLTTEDGVASLALANTLQRIIPLSPASRLVVTVGADDVRVLERPFNAAVLGRSNVENLKKGELVKMGQGELRLRNGNGSNTVDDFYTSITVSEGTLVLPQDRNMICYVRTLTVARDATLVTARNEANDASNASCWTVFFYLYGEGTITNRYPGTSYSYRFEPFGGSASEHGSFGGRITGRVQVHCHGYQAFTGKSDTTSPFKCETGMLYAHSFASPGQQSSLGAAWWVYAYGGGLSYSGQSFATNGQAFAVSATNTAFTLDGGPHGGATFTGTWIWHDATRNMMNSPMLRRVVLSGDGPNECVFAGGVTDHWASVTRDGVSSAVAVTGYFNKKGTGTWHFTDNGNRKNSGGYWVENGTLRYDSLEEAGRIYSLGTGTNLTYSQVTDLSTGYRPAHAIILGNNGTTGVFEYTGTNGYFCAKRPLRIINKGVFRTNAERPIRFADVQSWNANPTTLVLDGSSACTNEMLDVSDGGSTKGALSVEKDGPGTWKLGGYQQFSGTLAVKQGKLIVKQTEPGPYTWFRFTLTDYARPNGSYGSVALTVSRLSLFSSVNSSVSDGSNQIGWKTMAWAQHYSELQPGQIALQDGMPANYDRYSGNNLVASDNTPEKMFYPVNYGYGLYLRQARGALPRIMLTDRTSHIPIIMRVPEGSPEAVAFDYVSTFGSSNHAGVKGYRLEGSVDGMHWETVAEDAEAPIKSSSYQWVYGTKSNISESDGCCQFSTTRSTATYKVLNNVKDVIVSGGAVMEAEGNVALSTLTVDAADTANGVASVSGFAFGAVGSLKVTGMTGFTAKLPLAVSGTSAKNVEKWSVYVNGELVPSMHANVAANGRVSVFPAGTAIFMR